MANKVITIVVDTLEQSFDKVLAAAVNELHSTGNTIKQIRVTDDSGETVIPTNTIEGVTVHEPVAQTTVPAEPTPEPEPEPEPTEPEPEPADPTEPPVDVPPSEVTSPA